MQLSNQVNFHKGNEMSEDKDDDMMLATRVDRDVHKQFSDLCQMHRLNISSLLRELVIGFIEGRVTIAPPKDLLYTTTKE